METRNQSFFNSHSIILRDGKSGGYQWHLQTYVPQWLSRTWRWDQSIQGTLIKSWNLKAPLLKEILVRRKQHEFSCCLYCFIISTGKRNPSYGQSLLMQPSPSSLQCCFFVWYFRISPWGLKGDFDWPYGAGKRQAEQPSISVTNDGDGKKLKSAKKQSLSLIWNIHPLPF